MSNAAGQDPQLRAGIYARLSETYDVAESVPTQLANGERHAERRGWVVAGRFKDDGYSAYKEITRDDFVRLVGAIEAGELDVVIVRGVGGRCGGVAIKAELLEEYVTGAVLDALE